MAKKMVVEIRASLSDRVRLIQADPKSPWAEMASEKLINRATELGLEAIEQEERVRKVRASEPDLFGAPEAAKKEVVFHGNTMVSRE